MKCGNSAATAIAAAHDLRKTIGGRSNQFESIRQPVFPAAAGAHTQMGWMEVALWTWLKMGNSVLAALLQISQHTKSHVISLKHSVQ